MWPSRPIDPTPTLAAVQRSLGRRRLDGGFIGGPIGLLIGGVAGWAIGNDQRSPNEPNGSQRSIGIVIGALIGAAFAPSDGRTSACVSVL